VLVVRGVAVIGPAVVGATADAELMPAEVEGLGVGVIYVEGQVGLYLDLVVKPLASVQVTVLFECQLVGVPVCGRNEPVCSNPSGPPGNSSFPFLGTERWIGNG
jgi:hypothetical protein